MAVKFVVSSLPMEYDLPPEEEPPVPGAVRTECLYGLPPQTKRVVWIAEIGDLTGLMDAVVATNGKFSISRSACWSGERAEAPGERLFGIIAMDDTG